MAIDFTIMKSIAQGYEGKLCAPYEDESVGEFLYENRHKLSQLSRNMLVSVSNLSDTIYKVEDVSQLKNAANEAIEKIKENNLNDLEHGEETLEFLHRLIEVCDIAMNQNSGIIALID